MNRLPWIVVIVAAVGLLAFLFWYTPERRAADAVPVPTAPAAPTAASLGSAARPTPPVRSAATAAPLPPGSPAAVIDAGPPDPAGPFDVELGWHTVYLKDPAEGRVMNFTLHLVVSNKAGEKEIRLRREELLRMTFFLGSHRLAEGALGEAGRDRFQEDLLERFRNVVRSGNIEQVRLEQYEVGPRPKGPQ